jgi:hypothetical protein
VLGGVLLGLLDARLPFLLVVDLLALLEQIMGSGVISRKQRREGAPGNRGEGAQEVAP